MSKCFGAWARLLVNHNRLVGFVALLLYLAASKYFIFSHKLSASNMRFFEQFP